VSSTPCGTARRENERHDQCGGKLIRPHPPRRAEHAVGRRNSTTIMIRKTGAFLPGGSRRQEAADQFSISPSPMAARLAPADCAQPADDDQQRRP